jgi:hypothetical protein
LNLDPFSHPVQHASKATSQEIEAMTETIKTISFMLMVIGVLFLAFRITGWKMKKAGNFIIRDLREKKAFDPASAVELSYTKSPLLHIGLRDYRSQALQELLKQDIVRILEGGRYYLREGYKLDGSDDQTVA